MAPIKQARLVRAVFRRRLYVIALILIQISFIILVIASSQLFFYYINWMMHALSIAVCLYIINKNEKPAYKLTWVFLILLFPIFGGFLYIVFKYQSGRRKKTRKMRSQNAFQGDVLSGIIEKHKNYTTQARYLELWGYSIYNKTKTEYFDSGEKFFKKVLEELEKAEKYIFMEFFIIRQGVMLNSILNILERKAKAGLDIRFIYDDLGCFISLPHNFHKKLSERGIKCMIFNPFKPIFSSLQNNRDHRKIIVIDGKTAFTGGVNLGDEYINAFERFGHWKDAAIMVHGEAAWAFSLMFLRMWNLVGDKSKEDKSKEEDFSAFYPWKDTVCDVVSDGYVQPYADDPIDPENIVEHIYLQIINNAKDYVYINTPYLIVDANMVSALTLAAKSGIDVRIMTPHFWDKKIAAFISRSYYRELVSAGVKVYEYINGFNHSKTFVSDDIVASVGTANLDFRSLYLHYECGVCVYESSEIARIKQDFLSTLPLSKQITLSDCSRNALQRVIQDILRLFAPLM